MHGEFKQGVDRHLQGHNCKKCANESIRNKRQLGLTTFINKSNIKHNNKYDYSEIKEYINNSTKYNIICKEHGSFLQRANDHLNGQGCPECGKRNLVGFRRSNYININKDRICTLYVIHCFNNEESFYKLGITSGKINRRYKCSKSMPYNYEVIFNIKGSAEDVWNKEAGLKSKLNSKYIPLIPFGGSLTECYTDLDEIKSHILFSI